MGELIAPGIVGTKSRTGISVPRAIPGAFPLTVGFVVGSVGAKPGLGTNGKIVGASPLLGLVGGRGLFIGGGGLGIP